MDTTHPEDSGSLKLTEGRLPAPPKLTPPAGLIFAPASPELHATVVTNVRLRDLRFHTSADLTGSDARSKDPDYSIVYAEVSFQRPGWTGVGVGISFSLGRGNELLLAACRLIHPMLSPALRCP